MSVLKEIGGYFGLENYGGNEYHENAVAVNSGRNALLYLIKAHKIEKLYIPHYLCDTVYKLCEREEIPYEFYNVNIDFTPAFDKDLQKNEWIYIVNYYGQISNEQIKEYKAKYKNIVFDNVQSFFQEPVKGIDTVYSCRKFFGVPDGGYVYSTKPLNEVLKTDSSRERMTHILGRCEVDASSFYSDFAENDETFYDEGLKLMSPITKTLLKGVDYNAVSCKREENYGYLQSKLGGYNGIKLVLPKGPYCYPFYTVNGAKIRKTLIENKIYVPTLWGNVCETTDDVGKDYSINILPIPCDQRYGLEDMERIVKLINKLL